MVCQWFRYHTTYLDATVQYHSSNMILNIKSNASYLSAPQTKSHAAEHLFLFWSLSDTQMMQSLLSEGLLLPWLLRSNWVHHLSKQMKD